MWVDWVYLGLISRQSGWNGVVLGQAAVHSGLIRVECVYLGFKWNQSGLNKINYDLHHAHLDPICSKGSWLCGGEIKSMEVKISISEVDMKIFSKFSETSQNPPNAPNTSQYFPNASQEVRIKNPWVYYYLFNEIRSILNFD